MTKEPKSIAEIEQDITAFLGGDVALYWPGRAGGGGSRRRVKGKVPVVRPHARTSPACRWCGRFHTTAEHDVEPGAGHQVPELRTSRNRRSRTKDKASRSSRPRTKDKASRNSRSRAKGNAVRATKATSSRKAKRAAGRPAHSPLSLVHGAVTKVKGAGRFGDRKVFVSALWQRVGRKLGMSLAEFKVWLAAQHRAGSLQLARADLVAAMDPKLVASSEIQDRGAEFHFVVDPGAKEPWR